MTERRPDSDERAQTWADYAEDHRLSRRLMLAAGAGAIATALSPAAFAQSGLPARGEQTRFKRIPTQFIAALGGRDATSGGNAHEWGLWRRDPGPRGVRLHSFDELRSRGGRAPAGWRFDADAWWLEEHGLIMEAPEFPMPAGKYMVTGNRETKSVLTVEPPDDSGAQRWALADGATLYDVTHLRCRSARYTPASEASTCTPAQAKQSDFPVEPGAPMPPVEGCNKQDFAVLIVIGVAVENDVA